MSELITKEQYRQWASHPVTKALESALVENREECLTLELVRIAEESVMTAYNQQKGASIVLSKILYGFEEYLAAYEKFIPEDDEEETNK